MFIISTVDDVSLRQRMYFKIATAIVNIHFNSCTSLPRLYVLHSLLVCLKKDRNESLVSYLQLNTVKAGNYFFMTMEALRPYKLEE